MLMLRWKRNVGIDSPLSASLRVSSEQELGSFDTRYDNGANYKLNFGYYFSDAHRINLSYQFVDLIF